MELESNIELESDSGIHCVKLIKNSKKMCMICVFKATENNGPWDRYMLKCGHYFHTRCFRRYVKISNEKVQCSVCQQGNIKDDQSFNYCKNCCKFGHNQFNCLQVIKIKTEIFDNKQRYTDVIKQLSKYQRLFSLKS